MQVPQRYEVVAVTRELIEIRFPEIEVPHGRNICLRGIAHVRVAGAAQVERDIELRAAHGHVRIARGIAHSLDAMSADLFGEFETAIQGACVVAADNPDEMLFAVEDMLKVESFGVDLRLVRRRPLATGSRDRVEIDHHLVTEWIGIPSIAHGDREPPRFQRRLDFRYRELFRRGARERVHPRGCALCGSRAADDKGKRIRCPAQFPMHLPLGSNGA
jgi:hypothetical protein